MNYYNEHDPKVAAWLRELIRTGLIPAGDVDERSITEIKPHELTKYTQCHFFAGIGGWSHALQLADWPATRPVWTGSCPCQPFSSAGKQLGQADERHLWPAFFELIRECRPDVIFGEQVASAIGKGWLDGISADLEAESYACGAAVLAASSVGSPHIRQRLYWVADANIGRERGGNLAGLGTPRSQVAEQEDGANPANQSGNGSQDDGRLAYASGSGCKWREDTAGQARRTGTEPDYGTNPANQSNNGSQDAERLADTSSERLNGEHAGNEPCGVGNANGAGLGQQCGAGTVPQELATTELRGNAWDTFDLIPCADGKTRRIESGLAPLAHGVPARVVRLRGFGNAIVPQVAAEFIGAYLDI